MRHSTPMPIRRQDLTRRSVITAAAATLCAPHLARAATNAVALDYAYYSPLSLVLRDQDLLARQLGASANVTWVQSAGSNKALEYLRGRSIDVGSTAGAAALLGRANGAPVKIVAIAADAEWTALVTRSGSPIRAVADLRGRTVAATPGTDPAIFLARALATAGLTRRDITLVPLQHAAGRAALDRGQVDAWAGLDPFMAEAELASGDRLFFRDPTLVTPCTLLARDDVAASRPEIVRAVIAAYAEARTWALAHPDALAALLAREAHLPLAVAQRQLARTRFPVPAVTAADRDRIAAAGPILAASGSLSAGGDSKAALATLFAPPA